MPPRLSGRRRLRFPEQSFNPRDGIDEYWRFESHAAERAAWTSMFLHDFTAGVMRAFHNDADVDLRLQLLTVKNWLSALPRCVMTAQLG